VLITSRVHSAETYTSLIFNRFLEYLLSDDRIALKLRREYTFIMVPCLNPDGVVYGNYRFNIGGFDMNRQWEKPSKLMQPEIFYLKKLMNYHV
jgi:murein tripeptide amidase MpaA